MLSVARRVLPPGIDDDIAFGILWVKVGALKFAAPGPEPSEVAIQFWGQASPALFVPSESSPRTQEYDKIKCPITLFESYIRDMKRNLRVQVLNVGWISIDLTSYLKKNITLTSKTPFQHFKGFFDVVGKKNKRMGSLQIEFCANFSPQIALRELQADSTLKKTAQKCSDAEIVCGCKGKCSCQHQKVNSLDVLAVEKPELFLQFYEESRKKQSKTCAKKETCKESPFSNGVEDARIPNSLNTEPNKRPFEPSRYEEIPASPITQHFPDIQKVLTYSNLKLDHMQSKQEKQIPEMQPLSRQISIEASPHQPKQLIQPRHRDEQQNLGQTAKQQDQSLSVDEVHYKQTPKQLLDKVEKENLNAESQKPSDLGQQKKDQFLVDDSQLNKVTEEVSLEAQREILSRVIRLDEELNRQKKDHPAHESPLIKLPPPKLLSAPRYQQTQKRRSTLDLTMLIEFETASVSLGKKGKFVIRFRPYGSKQTIKLGPYFESVTTLMFPVGEPQVLRMKKTPFLVEFWDAVENSFLGLVKISLSKIYEGFLLEGRLNQTAIKTSLHPTSIHSGMSVITTLADIPCGCCQLRAFIGTTAQIQVHISSPKAPSIPRPQPVQQGPKSELPQKNTKSRRVGSIQDLTNLLLKIDLHEKSCLSEVRQFASLREASEKRWNEFLDRLQFKGGDPLNLLVEGRGEKLSTQDLSLCFDDYRRVKQHYQEQSQQQLKLITPSQILQLQKRVGALSKLGVVQKAEAQEDPLVQKHCSLSTTFLPELIAEQRLKSLICSQGKMPCDEFEFRPSTKLSKILEEVYFKQNPNCIRSVEQMLSEADSKEGLVPFEKVRKHLLPPSGILSSRWFWILLLTDIYSTNNQQFDPHSPSVNILLLYNWISSRRQKEGPLVADTLSHREKPSDFPQGEQSQKQCQGEEIRRQFVASPPHQTPSPKEQFCQKELQPELKKEREPPQQQMKTQQNRAQGLEEGRDELFGRSEMQLHRFTIKVEELQLNHEAQGQCSISYTFPHEYEPISSKKIQLLPHQARYKVISRASHQVTLSQPITSYLGQSTLHFAVSFSSVTLYGDLHSEELLREGVSTSVIPLFQPNVEGIIGKIKLRIEYGQERGMDDKLGRQTTQDVFLPKNGFLNYDISTDLSEAKMRQNMSLPPQFYIQLCLDIFGDSPALAPHYPPIISKLHSDLTTPLQLSGSCKLTLFPQIVEHFRGGTWMAHLVVIYYVKEQGNYQKKEVIFGTCRAPLLSSIRQGGLKGDFAFKNPLGMFTSLAHVTFQYQKNPRLKTQGQLQLFQEQSRELFWLVLDFSEYLNFEGELGWAKFEVIRGGRRYLTEKVNIRESGNFSFTNKCLSFQMTEDEFSDLKILPVKIITQQKNFAMDINLQAVTKAFSKQKYFVESQYFVVVNQEARLMKMRVGCKIYALRGNSELLPFVESLIANPLRDQGDNSQPYESILEGVRKKLKLSNRCFEQALGILLNRKKKEKLPLSFFSSTICPSLDATPILCSSQEDLDCLAEDLPSDLDLRSLEEYLDQTDTVFLNWRHQLIERYSFAKLNHQKLDQNIEYLGLHHEINLPVLLKKIKVEELSQKHSQSPSPSPRVLTLTIIRGFSFHLLYNGIKPNCLVKFPELSLETETFERSADPLFNQQIELPFLQLKQLSVEVYHVAGADSEDILIGEGVFPLPQLCSGLNKTVRVVVQSLMSTRMQASIDLKVEVDRVNDEERDGEEVMVAAKHSNSLIEDDAIEEALKRIKKADIGHKALLFQSDQD